MPEKSDTCSDPQLILLQEIRDLLKRLVELTENPLLKVNVCTGEIEQFRG
jgi:hypothetical protein